MSLLDSIKAFAIQLALPGLVGLGETALHDALKKLATEQPKKFGVALQTLYPAFKGVLEPLAHSTKTTVDDQVADPTVKMLEDLAKEVGVDLPVVVPIDFSTPEETATV